MEGKIRGAARRHPGRASAHPERMGLGNSGSGRDRHDNLGSGLISEADFEYFLNLPQLQKVPLILEVPGLEQEGPDAANIKKLKKLIHES